MKKRLSLLFILAGLSITVFSTAIADTLQDARQAIKKKNYSTAVIHLKNQLKETPKNAQARFLLGSVYLSTGKLDSSLKELSRAHDLAPNDIDILFRYVDALHASGNRKKVLELLNTPLNDKQQESQRLTYRGYAHIASNQLADARQDFEQANQLIKSAKAYNGLIALALLEKNLPLAEQLLSHSLSVDTDNPLTLQIKAKLANLKQQYEEALSIYNSLLEKDPNNLSLLLERAATLAILKKNKLAKADLNIILRKFKNHPQANFIQSQILLQERDFAGAQKAAQQVINVVPKHMPATFILGAANFALKNYNQAEEYLTIYLASNADNLKAQNLLANVYLAQGKATQSLLILDGLSQKQLESDPFLLVTLGNAYIQNNDIEKGIEHLSQAQKLAPDNQKIRKLLIAAQFKSGELSDAINELEQLTTIQNHSAGYETEMQTNYLLIISYIKNKQLTKAEKKIDQLLTQQADDTKLLNLKARTQQLNGYSGKAVAQYEAILVIDKNNIPAYMGLARLSALESNWQTSASYFKQVIIIKPDTLKAYLGLAAIAEKQKKPEAVEQYLFDALAQSKENITAQGVIANLMSQWYLNNKQPEKILSLAEKLDKQHPNEKTMRSFLAQAQILNKQNEQAKHTLNSIITFDKKDVKHRILLARLLSQNPKQANEAFTYIDEAKIIQPDNQQLYAIEASLLIAQNKQEEAINLAKNMQQKFPDSMTGILLEADIYRSQEKYQQALVIYQAVYKKEAGEKSAHKKVFSAIIDILLVLKRQDEAISLLTESIKATPDNFNNMFKLASLHHEKQQFEQAEIYYQRLLEKQPKQVIILNNLAWIKIGSDIKHAVRLAKQAYELAPDSAAIMDTYGYFLARDTQYEKGLELLQKAAHSLPKDMDIQYHLAFTYNKLGQINKSRDILAPIVNSKQPFSEKENAQMLYEAIK